MREQGEEEGGGVEGRGGGRRGGTREGGWKGEEGTRRWSGGGREGEGGRQGERGSKFGAAAHSRPEPPFHSLPPTHTPPRLGVLRSSPSSFTPPRDNSPPPFPFAFFATW